MAKNLVFGSDFMIYGAPFHKWYRFTYGAVTHVNRTNAIFTHHCVLNIKYLYGFH